MDKLSRERYMSGYHGEDSLRENAQRMFGKPISNVTPNFPPSFSSPEREKMRLYKEGGHVKHHRLTKEQTDLHIPRRVKTPRLNVERFEEAENMKRGGHAHHKHHYAMGGCESGKMKRGGKSHHRHHYEDGGIAGPMRESMSRRSVLFSPAPRVGLKRGGRARHYEDGGLTAPGAEAIARRNAFLDSQMMSEPNTALKRGGRAHHKHHGHHYEHGGMLPLSAGRVLPGITGMKKGGKSHHHHHKVYGKLTGMEMPGAGHHGHESHEGHHSRHKGHKSHKFAHGGTIYERQMVGEHPSHKSHHFNYEAEMMGEHATHKPREYSVSHSGKVDESHGTVFKRGGNTHHKHHSKMAMGGIGKIRHQQATKRGMPIHPSRITRG